MAKPEIVLEVNTQSLDVAIEKANRLVKLLQEASQLISSLGMGDSLGKALAQTIDEEIKNGISDCQANDRLHNNNDNLQVVHKTLVKQLELLHKRSMACAEGCFDDDLSELTRAMSAISEHLISKTNSSL